MDNFAEAISAVRDMRRHGVISEYAIGGAMAVIFWSEPTATYDLDVFVLLEQTGLLMSLERWAGINFRYLCHDHIRRDSKAPGRKKDTASRANGYDAS